MARIRTVKPELFRHECLFEAEQTTGLPIRLAWIGLFTVCDKAGRFRWRPRALKLDVLPYDDVDFSRVLDACATRGLLVKYRVGDAWYGCIPTWRSHQTINNRESESDLPPLDHADEVWTYDNQQVADACATREARGLVHAQGEGEGEGERINNLSTAKASDEIDLFAAEFWPSYPRKEAKPKAASAFRRLSKADQRAAIDGIAKWQRSGRWTDQKFIPLPASYLNARRWEDEIRSTSVIDLYGRGVV